MTDAEREDRDAPPLDGEPAPDWLARLSDRELMWRLARLRPEKYAQAYRETLAEIARIERMAP